MGGVLIRVALNEYSFRTGGTGAESLKKLTRQGERQRFFRSMENKKAYKQLLRFSSIGLEMGFSVAIGVGIGYLLDSYFDTKPWFLLIFFFVGIAAAFRSLFSLMKKFDKDKL